MIKKLSELKPYKSLLLARVQSSVPVKDIVDNLLEDLSELLSLGEDGPRTLMSEVNEINAGELAVGYLHYSEETPTPWTLNRNVVDQINHLIVGHTATLTVDEMKRLPGVGQVVRVSERYRVLGRHNGDHRPTHFSYQGIRFSQDSLNVFAGLCAVDVRENVELICAHYAITSRYAHGWGLTSRAPALTHFRGVAKIACLTFLSSRASTGSRSSLWR